MDGESTWQLCVVFPSPQSLPSFTTFPLYNRGSLNDMLFYISYKESHFYYVVERTTKGEVKFWPSSSNKTSSKSQLAHIKDFIENILNIIHALVDGLNTARDCSSHCNLHACNMVLDFTKDNIPRVGIIDWCLLSILRQTMPLEEHLFGVDNVMLALLEEKIQRGEDALYRKP